MNNPWTRCAPSARPLSCDAQHFKHVSPTDKKTRASTRETAHQSELSTKPRQGSTTAYQPAAHLHPCVPSKHIPPHQENRSNKPHGSDSKTSGATVNNHEDKPPLRLERHEKHKDHTGGNSATHNETTTLRPSSRTVHFAHEMPWQRPREEAEARSELHHDMQRKSRWMLGKCLQPLSSCPRRNPW